MKKQKQKHITSLYYQSRYDDLLDKFVLWIHKYGWIIQTIIAAISLIVALLTNLYMKELQLLMQSTR